MNTNKCNQIFTIFDFSIRKESKNQKTTKTDLQAEVKVKAQCQRVVIDIQGESKRKKKTTNTKKARERCRKLCVNVWPYNIDKEL